MGRLKLSIAVIITILILGIASVVVIQYKCIQMAQIVNEIDYSLENENNVSAISKLDEFDEYWYDTYGLASLIAKREKVSDITLSSVKLRSFIDADSEECTAELSNLRELIETLYKCEQPTWVNIF